MSSPILGKSFGPGPILNRSFGPLTAPVVVVTPTLSGLTFFARLAALIGR